MNKLILNVISSINLLNTEIEIVFEYKFSRLSPDYDQTIACHIVS